MFTKEDGGAFGVFYKVFDDFCNALQSWQECDKFSDKFKNLKGTSIKRIQQIYSANPKGVGYNVLNHADLNWKNLLHKKAMNGRVKDSMLIDYQCCHWGSPAIDVISLVDLVMDHGTKNHYRKQIVYEYHKHFVYILEKLGFLGNVPTLADLYTEMLRKGFLGRYLLNIICDDVNLCNKFLILTEVFHVAVFEQLKHIDLTETTIDELNNGHLENPASSKESYLTVVRAELPKLLHKGFLD